MESIVLKLLLKGEKMIILLFLHILIFNIQLFPQEKYNCSALLNPKYASYEIYTQTKTGMEIGYIITNDSITENYFVIQILDKQGDWFYVRPFDITDKKYEDGFIKIQSLVIFTSNYSGKLTLYEIPDLTSNSVIYETYNLAPLDVIDCKNGWLQVHFKNNWINIYGWLPPEFQCANPYSNCN